MRMGASRVASSSSHCPSSISTFGSRGRSVGILTYYSMSALLHLGKSTTYRDPGVECIQPSLDISGKLCLSSSHTSSSSSVQVSGGTCHRTIQTFDSRSTMLDGSSLASHSSQHVERCSQCFPVNKDVIMDVFGGPGAQGSPRSALNPLAAQKRCVAQKSVIFLSLSGIGGAKLSIYKKGLPAVLERMGRFGVLERVYQTMPYMLLNMLIFQFIYLGLAWLGIQLVLLFCLFSFFGTSSSSQSFQSSYHL